MNATNPESLASDNAQPGPRSLPEVVENVRELLRIAGVEPVDVTELMNELKDRLTQRVLEECEPGGSFEQTMFAAPFLTSQVETLRQQLLCLKDHVVELHARLIKAEHDPLWTQMMRVQFDDFVEQFLEFETALQNLRYSALTDDDQ